MVPILISFHGAQNCTLHAAIAEPCCRVQVTTRRNFPRYAYRVELRPNKKGAALCHHPDVVGSRLALYCCAEKRPRESAVGLYTLSERLLRSADPVLVSTMRKTIFLFGRRHAAAELALE